MAHKAAGVSPVAYRGAAPEPRREVTASGQVIASERGNVTSQAGPRIITEQEVTIDPNSLNRPDPRSNPFDEISTPPSNQQAYGESPPQQAQQVESGQSEPQPSDDLTAMRQNIAELQRQLAERQQAEEDLKFQMELAYDPMQAAYGQSAGYYPQAPPQLPPELNPDQAFTMKDAGIFAQNLMIATQVAATRAAWDLSPSEEQAALAHFPRLAQLPEPRRTQAIKEAAIKLRQRQAPATSSAQPAPPPSAQGSRTQPAPQIILAQPQRPTVAAPEAGASGSAGSAEPDQTSALVKAYADYDLAKKERNPRVRKQLMHDAIEKIARLNGARSYGDMFTGGFTQKPSQ